MSQLVSAVVVGADRLGNIPELLRVHNIAIRHHISGRDPSHQKKTLQLPSGTELLILLTDFLGHNVMKTFRAAAQRAGIRVLACRRSVCSMKQALNQCGYCESCQVSVNAQVSRIQAQSEARKGQPRVRLRN
ncbi:DUF2325 domain-containing protein [Pusillimonas sp. TS35]|uniref:DUF2325 domain-containing protein n=1 Tax=Paracandidimonas lactea TaxID=2895524 RepID=UPI00136A8F5F|nr:DUF2325 domain-containing protein [Paracandidimonas lactea]MYN13435.1 DUF2325 domain-containing protein [Pusillimonas sp. TS35]